jgi:predicted transcriptional regulator
MKLGIKPLTEQQELVMRLRKEEGMTYREIAEGLGVTPCRVQQICAEARRRLSEHEENPRESLMLLPARVRSILKDIEFHRRSEVLEAVQSGRLYYDEKRPMAWHGNLADMKEFGINVARLRNAGRQSWEILLQWLGFQTAEDQQEVAKRRKEELARKLAVWPGQRRRK